MIRSKLLIAPPSHLECFSTLDAQLRDAGLADWLTAEAVIELAHGHGRDELVHRGLKDLPSETPPFLRFIPNAAFYSTMLVAFALSQAFKEDVTAPNPKDEA